MSTCNASNTPHGIIIDTRSVAKQSLSSLCLFYSRSGSSHQNLSLKEKKNLSFHSSIDPHCVPFSPRSIDLQSIHPFHCNMPPTMKHRRRSTLIGISEGGESSELSSLLDLQVDNQACMLPVMIDRSVSVETTKPCYIWGQVWFG